MSSWKTLSSSEVLKLGLFRLRVDECELPDGRIMPRYYVIEFADWVNIVPVTPDGLMVMVRQYRQAYGETFLEIPGGSTDRSDNGHLQAGQRELTEETGYTADEWIDCGFLCPNPALQNNKLHTLVALNCTLSEVQKLDKFEDLTVERIPVSEIYRQLAKGEIKHSLIAASLTLAKSTLEARTPFLKG